MKSLVILFALCTAAHADDLYGGLAMDTVPVAKARYEHPFAAVTVPIELTVPVIRPGLDDGELRVGVRRVLRLSDRWSVGGTLAGFVRGTDNDAFRAGALGLDAEVIPAVALGRATLGLELGLDQSIGTYISNHDKSRAIYMDVKDGWYQTTQTSYRFGLRAALRIGDGELRLRTGVANELVPLFAELGYAVHL